MTSSLIDRMQVQLMYFCYFLETIRLVQIIFKKAKLLKQGVLISQMRWKVCSKLLFQKVWYINSRSLNCVCKSQWKFLNYLNVSVGAPQGTKLGLLLWLFYVNILTCDGLNVLKYADDMTFINLLIIIIPRQPPLFLTLSLGRQQVNDFKRRQRCHYECFI